MSTQRVIDGLFQAVAVRTAGFSIVSLSSVAPALQVSTPFESKPRCFADNYSQLLYVIMMYIVRSSSPRLHLLLLISLSAVRLSHRCLDSEHERLRGEVDGCVAPLPLE